MDLKLRQNHAEKWKKSLYKRPIQKLQQAAQTGDRTETGQTKWLQQDKSLWLGWILEDGAAGLNGGKYLGNFKLFWSWTCNRPQNPSVSQICSPVLPCKNWLLTAQSDMKGADLPSEWKLAGKFQLPNYNRYLLRLYRMCLCKGS